MACIRALMPIGGPLLRREQRETALAWIVVGWAIAGDRAGVIFHPPAC